MATERRGDRVALLNLCLCLLFVTTAYSKQPSSLRFTGNANEVELGLHYWTFTDSTKQLSIRDVLNVEWERAKSTNPSYGFTDFAHWIRIDVSFDSLATTKEWLLVVSHHNLSLLDVWFVMEDGSMAFDQTGNHASKYTSGNVERTRWQYDVALPDNEHRIRSIYLRATSQIALGLPISFRERTHFVERNDSTLNIMWVFVGVVTAMFVYNLFLFVMLRDRAYLLYLVYVLLFGVFASQTLTGYYSIVFASNPWVQSNFGAAIGNLANAAAILFALEFLRVRQHAPRLNVIMFTMFAVTLALAFGSLWVSPRLSYKLSNFTALPVILCMLSSSIIAIRKGYRPAVYFLIAWSVFMTFGIIFILANLGVIARSYITLNSIQIGSAAEMMLLSIALGARINEIRKARALLDGALPKSVADRMIAGEKVSGDLFEEVTVLFLDIVGFTAIADKLRPEQLVNLLESIFSSCDEICMRYGLTKIKTIGDSYMAVAGVPQSITDNQYQAALAATELIQALSAFDIRVRIGMHCGPVVAGVIGTERLQYDVWGDTVNTASRLESTSEPNRIHVSDAFATSISSIGITQRQLKLVPRGLMHIKGKGEMNTFWLET